MNGKKKDENLNEMIRDAMLIMGYRAYVYFRGTATDEGEAFELAKDSALKFVIRFADQKSDSPESILDIAFRREVKKLVNSPEIYKSSADYFVRMAKYISGEVSRNKAPD